MLSKSGPRRCKKDGVSPNVRRKMLNVLPFFWRPKDAVSSLADLPISGQSARINDVSVSIAGQAAGKHPLLVMELTGGKIIGDLRLAATENDIVIGGLQALFSCEKPAGHYLLKRRRFRLPRHHAGTALLLGASNSDNYYHWLIDSLPRWKLLQAAGWRDYDFVLLHSQPRAFQEETLDWLGVPAAKRLRCSKNFIHQFDQLVVPAMPFPPEEVSPWACAWLRSLLPVKPDGPEKIFLSRRGAGRRQLVNEAELQTALAAQGFVSIQPETLSVAEQAHFLSAARCVVAPHGAGLTNLVFSPPGAFLLELFHPQHKNHCYKNIAQAAGHRYASLDGQAIPHADAGRLDYSVDIPAVLQLIEQNSRGE